ncbi:acyl-CoA thioesterase [Glutamicibacter sp. NPDC087344]|uniref:acyl-CoA thioesterase n=1 Tax=Glutamicibacter sp. NPDC087344 TaxID=3363994 RepID=UPI0038014BA9
MVESYLAGALAGTANERVIEWVDTDAAGHQHNSAIMRFVEAAESKLFRELDLPEYFPIAPRVRQEVDYRAKLFFGQRVTTALRIDRLGEKSMSFSFEVFGHEYEGRPIVEAASGKFVTAHVPLGSDRSRPWPASILRVLVS